MPTDLLSSQDVFNTPDLKTKMRILHAVDRSLDCMTISEICKKANISRQTFYRHFRSKYDIPWWFCIFCRQFYLNESGAPLVGELGIITIFGCCRRNATSLGGPFSTASICPSVRRSCLKTGSRYCLRRSKHIETCLSITI